MMHVLAEISFVALLLIALGLIVWQIVVDEQKVRDALMMRPRVIRPKHDRIP